MSIQAIVCIIDAYVRADGRNALMKNNIYFGPGMSQRCCRMALIRLKKSLSKEWQGLDGSEWKIEIAGPGGFQLLERDGLPFPRLFGPPDRLFEQREMNVLPLQAMIMIEPFGVDERGAALAVLGDDLLAPLAADLFAELGELGAGLGEGDDVFGRDGHEGPPIETAIGVQIVHRIPSKTR